MAAPHPTPGGAAIKHRGGPDNASARPSRAVVQLVLAEAGGAMPLAHRLERREALRAARNGEAAARPVGAGAIQPGEYRMEIKVSDKTNGQSITRNVNFTVTD